MVLHARVRHDFLGEWNAPGGAYWGVHTARALENFPVSGTPVSTHRELVAALGAVKQAAVRANRELGLIDDRRADAIDRAPQDVRDGLLVTALTPYIGYAAAAEIAKRVLAEAGDIRQLVLATGALSEDALDDLLRPERLAGIGAGDDAREPGTT